MPNFITTPYQIKFFDNTKENNSFRFGLATLTVISNNDVPQFDVKVVSNRRKFPYFTGVEDNNGSTLPNTLDKTIDPVLSSMYGVHFYDKPLDLQSYYTVVGAINVPFYSRPTVNTNDGSISWSSRNVGYANTPSVLCFNALNGIDEPYVTVDGDRVNIYRDNKKVADTSDNPDDYKNIKCERRAYTPTPYRRVYDYSDTNRDYYIIGNNGFELIDRTQITDDDEIYTIDSKYGEYRKKGVSTNTANKIPHYKNKDVDLWKNPIIEHGIEVDSEFTDKRGNVVSDGTLFNDDGKYQYVLLPYTSTEIVANDNYHEVIREIITDTAVNASGITLLNELQDTIVFKYSGSDDNLTQSTKKVYFYYYLETPDKVPDYGDNIIYYGNPNGAMREHYYRYMDLPTYLGNLPYTLDEDIAKYFVNISGENYTTNYPYDQLTADDSDGGWKYTLEESRRFPCLFNIEESKLRHYPGYFYEMTVSGDSDISLNLRSYLNLYSTPGGTTLDNYELNIAYDVDDNTGQSQNEGIINGELNNLRFFTLTVSGDKRILSPVIDYRCIHIAITTDYLYIFPQRPTDGTKWANGSYYDILEMPYLTNYKFQLILGTASLKPVEVGNHSVLDYTNFVQQLSSFLRQGKNEYYDFAYFKTAAVDLPNRLGDATIERINFEYDRGINCIIRALKVPKTIFGDNVDINNSSSFAIIDAVGTVRWVKTSFGNAITPRNT